MDIFYNFFDFIPQVFINIFLNVCYEMNIIEGKEEEKEEGKEK